MCWCIQRCRYFKHLPATVQLYRHQTSDNRQTDRQKDSKTDICSVVEAKIAKDIYL